MDIEELEKIVLLGLYEFRIEGGFKSLNSFFSPDLMINRHQSKLIFNQLNEQGLVKGRANSSGYVAEITLLGIKYVEEKYMNADTYDAKPKLKMKDKYDLILKNLYYEKDDYHIDVRNLIPSYLNITSNESDEIGKELKKKGLVNLSISKTGTYLSITALGKEYVEDNLLDSFFYNPFDKFSETEKSELSTKLDELLERIKKLELGQQVTYDDFEAEFKELKVLMNVLGKKDWKQLLYGKLVDAGLGAISSKVLDITINVFKGENLLG